MQNPRPKRFLLKIFKNNDEVLRIETKKKGRISYNLQIEEKSKVQKYSIRVTYEQFIDSNNKKVAPQNKGSYKTKKELKHALRYFCE